MPQWAFCCGTNTQLTHTHKQRERERVWAIYKHSPGVVVTSDISCTCHISMSLYFGKQFQLIHNQCTNVLSIINCWRFISSQCSQGNNKRATTVLTYFRTTTIAVQQHQAAIRLRLSEQPTPTTPRWGTFKSTQTASRMRKSNINRSHICVCVCVCVKITT